MRSGEGGETMQEWAYVAETFGRNFSDRRGEPCVLYGLGRGTEAILAACPEFSFLGLLDGFQESGTLYGQPVLSLAQVAERKPAYIVVVARAQSVRIIARRIASFCRAQGIGLWDVQGRDLLVQEVPETRQHAYFSFTLEQAKQEILAHDVISFDVFDTLLMRCTLMPEDVFALMERRLGIPGLAKAREQAEHTLYRQGNPTLEEIEQETGRLCHLTAAQTEALAGVELSIERAVLVPRRDAVALLSFAVAQGKRVFLISDMYLSETQLRSLLSANQITGYEGLLVSTACQSLKTQRLFEIFQARVPAASYLHFGDNEEADIACARRCGMDAQQLMSGADLLALSAWRGMDAQCASLEERLLFGVVVAQVFNSPFALSGTDGRPLVDTAQAFGGVFLSPLLVSFLLWLLRQTAGKYQHIFWSARDGYLLLRMQRCLQARFPGVSFPKGHYLYISRIAATAAGLQDAEDLRYAASIGFAGSARELLVRRFFLRREEILPQRDGETLEAYVLRHTEVILARAAQLRQSYQAYVQTLGIAPEEAAVFFDLISSGTGQVNFENITGRKYLGLYMIFIQEGQRRKRNLTVRSFLETGGLYALQSYLSRNYEPVENLVMSDEPTLLRFDREGRPVFASEPRSDAELAYTEEVQEGVLRFLQQYLSILGDWQAVIRPAFADQLYQLIRSRYTRVEHCVFAQEMVRDDFTGRDYRMADMFD